ncbi:hypothetical protein F0U44_02755 [Nocardioides humilatus]|uniref:Uncharacterized protein n=1 Tax=Nocardioides humilatus TaxID=2607660 RepID=A0A5B1LNM8_9ACTN|nr:hypothetical protein [Nocardioides humilatus]KAA1421249.1 hypothetical protein F0U44_02755 [Nocardioides humilatus]
MNRFMLKVGVVVVALVALVVGLRLAQDGGPPYTEDEMTSADIDCGTEAISKALAGASSRNDPAVRAAMLKSFHEGSNPDCLRRKLPELSDDEIENFSETLEEARTWEQEHSGD